MDGDKLIILDDVFDAVTKNDMLRFNYKFTDHPEHISKWFKLGENPLHEKIFNIAAEYFDLSNCNIYELWANKKTLDWHKDADEVEREKTGKIKYTICTAIYYPKVRMEGGALLTPTVSILPIENRLILFSSEIPHKVNPYSG
ncbi:MAG: 2OG-Fe(II) oxygenase, partial [Methylococcales bacterium]